MLKQLVSAADLVSIFGFFLTDDDGPEAGEVLWPAFNNPHVNRLRHLRRAVVGKPLYTQINPTGAPLMLGTARASERVMTFEEVEWCVFATIGARFDGIIWGGKPYLSQSSPLARLEARLGTIANELGKAQAVPWVKSQSSQPCTALATPEHLFVVILNPNYMVPTSDGKQIILPVSCPIQTGTVGFDLPPGVTLQSGRDLSGHPLAGSAVTQQGTADYRFSGGGTILVFDIVPALKTMRPAQDKAVSFASPNTK